MKTKQIENERFYIIDKKFAYQVDRDFDGLICGYILYRYYDSPVKRAECWMTFNSRKEMINFIQNY